MVSIPFGQQFASYADAASSQLINLTAAGSNNTKGSYVEITSSTPFPAYGFIIWNNNASGSADFLFDLAIGGSGSEQVIWSNIVYACSTQARRQQLYVPLFIPAGVRLAARCQASTASRVMTLGITLIGGSPAYPEIFQTVTTYGANTGNSGGVQIDPGGTINTKGSYAQITASTTAPIKFLIVGITNKVNTVRATYGWLMDIAIGGSGSENIIIPNIPLWSDLTIDIMEPGLTGFPVDIPMGTRIVARAQCSGNDATDRLFDMVLYGLS
jgi:hypothetical protein